MLLNIVKEYFRHYKYEFIISLFLVIGFMYASYIYGCSYKLSDGVIVHGVCKQLIDYEANRNTVNFSTPDGVNVVRLYDKCPICITNVCKPCECKPCELGTTTTSHSTTSTTIVQECNCPICPKMDNIDYQDVKNARPDLGSSAYQQGYFNMKKRCLTALGMKTSKFNEGPGILATNTPHLNKTQTVVFELWNGEFFINKTWDIKDGISRWIVRPHVNTLNNTWENGSYKPPL